MNLKNRSFLTLLDFKKEEIEYLLSLSFALKAKKKGLCPLLQSLLLLLEIIIK